ncbi:ABC transporter permease [Alteromonas gracilis]|uniref:ABC transporter permease n=1 Tax=Alteromonas gracilis TaxID=1479524 RepID=UPI003736B0B3
MRSSLFHLVWRLYIQDIKSSHFKILQFTQALLITFLITLTLVGESVQKHLAQNMANLLGADVVVAQFGALSLENLAILKRHSNDLALTKSVKTTLTYKGKWQQVTLKAVSDNYPLQGQVHVSRSVNTVSYATNTLPSRGEIWIDSRLSASLAIDVGHTITIANQLFNITRIVHHEPDRLMEGHNVDMRALMHVDDFVTLNFNDDNIEYRYLLNANKAQIQEIIAAEKQAFPSANVRHRLGAHPLAQFWQRTENFIGLAFTLLLFMAAIAIYQISRIQIKKEQYFAAVCMSLGATRIEGLIVSIYKWFLQVLALLPVILVIATVLHWVMVKWLSTTLLSLHWQPSLLTAFLSFCGCVLLLALFQLPIWFSIRVASVKQLIFNQSGKQKQVLTIFCLVTALLLVVLVYSDNSLLTVMLLGAMASCICLIALFSYVSLWLGEKLTQHYSGLIPFATFMMKQRLVSKTTQIMGVGLCAFLLLFTLMLLRDVGNTFQSYSRQFDGNVLISQADEAQMQTVAHWVHQHRAQIRQQKPFMYAKLLKVNGQFIEEFAHGPSESLATLQRAIRLHWTNSVPKNNRVIEGQFWPDAPSNWQQVSVEQEVMTDIGLNIGDTLTFAIAGNAIDFTIAASHAYAPGAGSITFWVQMPATATAHIQAAHFTMASIEADRTALPALSELWQQHPSLRMVSLQEMTKRFDDTLALVTQIISGFAAVILSLACVVIVSSVLTYEQNERKKNSVIMSFGLPRKMCLNISLIEWVLTGAIAAVGAMFSTWIAGMLIYQSQFAMTYQPNLMWMTATLCIIILTVVTIGYVASRRTLSCSIRELLTE